MQRIMHYFEKMGMRAGNMVQGRHVWGRALTKLHSGVSIIFFEKGAESNFGMLATLLLYKVDSTSPNCPDTRGPNPPSITQEGTLPPHPSSNHQQRTLPSFSDPSLLIAAPTGDELQPWQWLTRW
jgi:hypothetical protein